MDDVYPLEYLTTSLLGPIVNLSRAPAMEGAQFLMLTYSTGTVLIFGTFGRLYQHAWRRPRQLDLSPAEEISLQSGQRAHLLTMPLGGLGPSTTS